MRGRRILLALSFVLLSAPGAEAQFFGGGAVGGEWGIGASAAVSGAVGVQAEKNAAESQSCGVSGGRSGPRYVCEPDAPKTPAGRK